MCRSGVPEGRRTVTTWLRAAGVSDDYQDYYYLLAALGGKTESVASRLFALILAVLPLLWYFAVHFDDYRRFSISDVVLLGYVAVAAFLVCAVSGAVRCGC